MPPDADSPLCKWLRAHQAKAGRWPPKSVAPIKSAKRRAELAKIDARVNKQHGDGKSAASRGLSPPK